MVREIDARPTQNVPLRDRKVLRHLRKRLHLPFFQSVQLFIVNRSVLASCSNPFSSVSSLPLLYAGSHGWRALAVLASIFSGGAAPSGTSLCRNDIWRQPVQKPIRLSAQALHSDQNREGLFISLAIFGSTIATRPFGDLGHPFLPL